MEHHTDAAAPPVVASAPTAEDHVNSDSDDVPRVTLTTTGYIKCSLCNHIIDDEASHLAGEHAHLRHIHTMLAQPLPPLFDPAADPLAVGRYALATSLSADRGPVAFRVVQRAQQQLQRVLEGMQGSDGFVYAFGSVVSMGSWDGEGDADFSFVDPTWYHTPAADGQTLVVEDDQEGEEEEEEEEVEDAAEVEGAAAVAEADTPAAATPTPPQHHWDPETAAGEAQSADEAAAFAAVEKALLQPTQVISSEREKRIIRNVTARLRDIGFRFEELDPVLHTRIPVMRRKRPTHVPLNLRAMQQQTEHLIRISFDRASAETQFRAGRLHTLMSTYGAREVSPHRGQGRDQVILAVPDSGDAVHLLSRRERIPGVRKMWHHGQRTPEIFAIDFDLSCRYHGIRNSWLLRRYLEQDEVFRMGNVFLKKWSKACGLNNSRVGFLTSYAISVLWVYFLLRRSAVTFVTPEDVPLLPDPDQQSEIPYVPLWPTLEDAVAEDERTARLGTLLRDFFYFYGEEFDWATEVVSIRQPCPTAADVRTKADLGWLADNAESLLLRERCYHIFSIEDVYEDDLDLGRHLTPDKAAWSRLQFRLAYARCSGGPKTAGATLVTHLLDVPQKRAAAVLRARLYRHLLVETEEAAATVRELLPSLCPTVTPQSAEDPTYLLSAYELGSRLSDLWYDEEQVGLDVANHKRYDRRANLFTEPPNPTATGAWGAVCVDPLSGDGNGSVTMEDRWVRLEPPAVLNGTANDTARGAPKRQRDIQLRKEVNVYTEVEQTFHGVKAGGGGAAAAAPSVVGLLLPRSSREAVYPHCFFPLQTHRLFDTYAARETFVRCLEDIAWELARLHEVTDDSAAPAATFDAALTSREHLVDHLMQHLHSSAATLPGYAALLSFIVGSTDYIVFQGMQGVSVLCPTRLLLQIVGTGGAAAEETPVVAAKVGAPAAARRGAKPGNGRPPSDPTGRKSTAGNTRPAPKPPAPRSAAASGPLKMNEKEVRKGTCGECKHPNVLTYPSTQPQRDPGYYCADCWSRY